MDLEMPKLLASAIMKRLRTVITDRKLTKHSLHHRMKDGLRNTG